LQSSLIIITIINSVPVHKYLLLQKLDVSSLIQRDFRSNISNTGDGRLVVLLIIIVLPTLINIPDPKKEE